MAERASDRIQKAGGEDFLGIDRYCSGFDLGEVEDIADQIEQVGPRAMDGAGEFDLLRGQVAVGVFRELLAQDQDAVERRAQLMRHVGQEFGFVLGRQRKLRRLFLERTTGLLDLLVLALDFDVALGKLLSLLLQLLVSLLQFPLLRLQFAGQLLGLFQEPFGLHRGFDRVEYDADGVGELFEEGHLRGRERTHRGELDDRLDLVFEQDRQDDGVARCRLEQHRADGRERLRGNVGGGEVLIHIRRITRLDRFGQHVAVAIGIELIDERAPEARNALYFLRRELANLLDRGLHIAGVRRGHGLDGNRRIAADLDLADLDLPGFASRDVHVVPTECGTT